MKFILKILFAPVFITLWLLCGICNLCVRVSAAALSFVAILFALAGVITIVTGSLLKGCIGLVIALALSPYGLPMVAALVLARFCGLRIWLKDTIYG